MQMLQSARLPHSAEEWTALKDCLAQHLPPFLLPTSNMDMLFQDLYQLTLKIEVWWANRRRTHFSSDSSSAKRAIQSNAILAGATTTKRIHLHDGTAAPLLTSTTKEKTRNKNNDTDIRIHSEKNPQSDEVSPKDDNAVLMDQMLVHHGHTSPFITTDNFMFQPHQHQPSLLHGQDSADVHHVFSLSIPDYQQGEASLGQQFAGSLPLQNASLTLPQGKQTTTTEMNPGAGAAVRLNLSNRLPSNTRMHIVSLNVGGRIFSTTSKTLEAVENSYFYKISRKSKNDTNEYFIDRNGDIFEYILDYLRSQRYKEEHFLMPEEKKELQMLKKEAKFYNLPVLEGMAEAALVHFTAKRNNVEDNTIADAPVVGEQAKEGDADGAVLDNE